MEQELVHYQAFMNAFIHHATDAIGIVDREGRGILVNPAWEGLYGYELSEISGKSIPFISKDITDRIETEEWMRRSEKLAVSGELASGTRP